ncbi:MAG: DUF2723 domain-containing protein [Candidatus Eisenbacteria bacterium]
MLHRGIPGGDSGELIAVAHTLGTAHPPGYPLWTLLAWAWSHVFAFGSVAWRLNLFSAVCAALAAATLAATVERLPAGSLPPRLRTAAAIPAGFALAFAPPFWKYALVAEVFALHALLAAIALAAFVEFLRRNEAGRAVGGPIVLLALLGGLQVSHHHSLILLWLPLAGATAWLLVRSSRPPRRAGALRAAGAFVLGLAPLLHLPWAASRMPPAPLSWGDPVTPARLLRLLTRGDYGTFQLDPREAGLVADRSHVLLWLESLPRDFWPWGVALALAGLVLLARDPRRRPLAFALLAYFALQVAFFTRVGFPTTPAVYLGVVERFYILPAVVVALLIGAGSTALLAWIHRRARGGDGWPAATGIAAGVLALSFWGFLIGRMDRMLEIDQQRNHLVADLADGVLASLPPRAVLFVQGDLFHNALAVRTLVEGARPDVTVIDQELLTYSWQVARIRRRDPSLLPPRLGAEDRYDGTPASGNGAWIDHLLPRRPVAFLGLKEHSYADRYALVPTGYVLRAQAKSAVMDPRARAREGLAIFGRLHLESAFRRYDPWSFEDGERARMTECLARTTRLLCVPEAAALTPQNAPGFAPLLAALECSRLAARQRGGPPEDPEVVRVRGYLYALHPAVRDAVRAEEDLARVLTREPAGPRAEEARRVLVWLRALRVAAAGSKAP